MHRLLKSLYIRRVSADYRFAIFRDVTYKLHLHHYSWPQVVTTHSLLCHLYLDEPNTVIMSMVLLCVVMAWWRVESCHVSGKRIDSYMGTTAVVSGMYIKLCVIAGLWYVF